VDLDEVARNRFWRRELVPDPHGIVGFALVAGVLFSHLTLPAAGRSYLWSESFPFEVLGHLWLILGPPLGVYLGTRHLIVKRDSLLPLLSVPLGLLLTGLTLTSLLCALILL